MNGRSPEPLSDSSGIEKLLIAGLLSVLGLIVTAWAIGGVAGAVFGSGWPKAGLFDMFKVIARLPENLTEPKLAWPKGARHDLPGPIGIYVSMTSVLLTASLLGVSGWKLRGRLRSHHKEQTGRWGRRHDFKELMIKTVEPGRLTLGRVDGRLVAAEPQHSVAVLGPAGSGKTTALAVPAILEWQGPIVVASVKPDIFDDTVALRHSKGRVWLFDPVGSTGIPSAQWTPLGGATTWMGAWKTAEWLTAATGGKGNSVQDEDFWHSMARKLIAPLLLAANRSNGTMADVVSWINTKDLAAPQMALKRAGEHQALEALSASGTRDERQESSVYSTAEMVLEAYVDPNVMAVSEKPEITANRLLDGTSNTLYIVAPTHEQRRLRPLFSALIGEITNAVYDRVSRSGEPLDPPLLLILDECANIAPLKDLDVLASTARGHGIQLVTVFQDLGQVEARWGKAASTIINNHKAKVVLSGISCRSTLSYLREVLGDEEITKVSATVGERGKRSTTESTVYRPLGDAATLRGSQPGTGVLLYGHLPAAQLVLRPWFSDRALARLATATG